MVRLIDHEPGCWRVHLACALAEIERLNAEAEKARPVLAKLLREVERLRKERA